MVLMLGRGDKRVLKSFLRVQSYPQKILALKAESIIGICLQHL